MTTQRAKKAKPPGERRAPIAGRILELSVNQMGNLLGAKDKLVFQEYDAYKSTRDLRCAGSGITLPVVAENRSRNSPRALIQQGFSLKLERKLFFLRECANR